MMFTEFFLWGAWYVSMGTFLFANDMGGIVGWAYSVGPIAAIVSPFFTGMIADRFFATERVLGVMQILGGVALRGSVRLRSRRTCSSSRSCCTCSATCRRSG